MKKFKEHFLMNKEDIKEYVTEELGFFQSSDQLEVEEIGDGNINYVFLVKNMSTQKSLVIKQADKYLRSSGRLLDLKRNKIEADILRLQYKLVPEYIPKIYHYDETMSALVMEDISSYKNLRYELYFKKIYPNLAQEISTFLADVLFPTTDLVWDRQDKKRQVQKFINIEMCDISEDLVFTEPYNDYKKQNVILDGNLVFVEQLIYQNKELQTEVGKLRNNYLNHAQSLLHGDLHTGSIFINETGLKIIDPEFAFYGPMGYDIGNVIGHLFFPLAKNAFFDEDIFFSNWLEKEIQDVYDLVKEKLEHSFDKQVVLSLYQTEKFKTDYLNSVMADSLGYAGTEIIRRVIGDSKVLEITDAPFGKQRIFMERVLLKFGVELILTRKKITTGKELLSLFNKTMEEEMRELSGKSR